MKSGKSEKSERRAKRREKKTRHAGDRLGGFPALLRLLPHLRVQRSANAPRPSASDTEAPSFSHVLEAVGQKLSTVMQRVAWEGAPLGTGGQVSRPRAVHRLIRSQAEDGREPACPC